ncbi:MBL fold metallo-hydrolase [Flavonifractor sp. An91]|uniref:MBL fold metallo-hydrolase n=1 Tax=Flavonifractor sp. An91 TaxID=1965665 RepID=UPI000B375B91|nr:MBL fold metallo-hydrolase [Flavonifractor sp. An91]OUN10748.1 MBL fold metallo-hydrolase [Flavonifractor sp. An91]
MLQLCTLASGSSGNSLLVSDGATHILVDAGISCRRITTALKGLGVDPASLSAVLITHEHTDHISGLTTLTKQRKVPVYASRGTGRQLCYRIAFLEEVLHPFTPGACFSIGSIDIETFPTPHDAAESTGYALSAGGRKAAVVTDLGHVTEAVEAGIRGANLLVAEANHDVEWLRSGPYPYFLKDRILGDRGHLSNEAGAALVCSAVSAGTSTVVLAHLSHENNTPERARQVVGASLTRMGAVPGQDVLLEVAPRSEPGRRYTV